MSSEQKKPSGLKHVATPQNERDQFNRIRNLVKRYGFTLAAVEEDSGIPEYSYTVGLSHQIGYEFLITGLLPKQAQQLTIMSIEMGVFAKDKPQPKEILFTSGLNIQVSEVQDFFAASFCPLYIKEFPIAEGGKLVHLQWPDSEGKHVGDLTMSEIPHKVQDQDYFIRRLLQIRNPGLRSLMGLSTSSEIVVPSK